jgi:hypothetical protein
MNFPPIVKAWLKLIALVLSTGITSGLLAHSTGASVAGACLVGLSTAATHVGAALGSSPKENAAKEQNKPKAPYTLPRT